MFEKPNNPVPLHFYPQQLLLPTCIQVDNAVDKKSDRFLSGADLAKRLGVNPGILEEV